MKPKRPGVVDGVFLLVAGASGGFGFGGLVGAALGLCAMLTFLVFDYVTQGLLSGHNGLSAASGGFAVFGFFAAGIGGAIIGALIGVVSGIAAAIAYWICPHRAACIGAGLLIGLLSARFVESHDAFWALMQFVTFSLAGAGSSYLVILIFERIEANKDGSK